MEKVSVIIPVYNAEKTLEYCLKSVLDQTYTNYEIIIINDGSKDDSQKIIDKYTRTFPGKIRAFQQVNSGVAIARNKGIEYSQGKFIFFMDNDDYIDKDYLSRFTNEIQRNGADVVIGGYRKVKRNGEIIYLKKITKNPWSKYLFIAAWGKVYRRSSIIKHNLKFLDINIGDDLYMNMIANLKLNTQYIDYTGYNWVYNPISVSNTAHKGLDSSIAFLPLLETIHKKIKNIKKTQETLSYVEYFFIKTSIYYLLHSGRGVDYQNLKSETKAIFGWLEKIILITKKINRLAYLSQEENLSQQELLSLSLS